LKQADLSKMNATLPDPPATLQNREIEQVADFLFAKVVGKGPMDRASASSSGAATFPPAPNFQSRGATQASCSASATMMPSGPRM
jgi:hypothetical protein